MGWLSDYAKSRAAKWEDEAACAEGAGMTWQPIDTAPRGDGIHDILVYIPLGMERRIAFWDDGELGTGWYDITGCVLFDGKEAPTHWMPLPEPPHPI